ncbi:conserved exported hypothetical protein [Desulfamplus magnetovallimortis]|uniref:Uncharacterized protein n=1 Tax=Desulfamplus magnetovallimortis TaxID=1246637 RepID=A0A1W1H5H3_9BACT|nr:hypothetical protein [Desulfamplus magnetovallimortis]SLM27702.1 conserved exported hypothetical protein [Desulfamplus magnetovallimortis]
MKNNIATHFLITCNVVLIIIIATASTLSAGAWTMEKGKSYHRFAANYFFADNEFDQNGDSRNMPSNGEFKDFNLNYYMEYGIVDKLSILTSFYYKEITKEDNYFKYETTGTGDFDLGLRYQLYAGNLGVFSIQGILKIPELYDEKDALSLGNGQYDYEARLMYGRSLWSIMPVYINLESAYRWRAEEPSDEFRYLVEIGSDIGKKLYTRIKLDGLISAGNGKNHFDNYGNPTATFEYDLTKIDLTLGCKVSDKMGLEFGYTAALWGESTAKGDTWTLALSFQP